jgi:hypothetical protein
MLDFPPPQITQPIYGAIGQIAIHWALLEFNIDGITNIIFTNAGGNAIEKTMPTSLKKKTDFIKRSLNKLESLSAFTEGRQLMIDIDRESQLRHDVIHGYIAGFNQETNELHFVKLKTHQNEHYEGRKIYTFFELMDAGTRSLDLGGRTNNFANKLLKAFMLYDERDKPF